MRTRLVRTTKFFIKTNRRIVAGFNQVYWILAVLTSSTLITYVIVELRISVPFAALSIPVLSIMVFYIIGVIHERSK